MWARVYHLQLRPPPAARTGLRAFLMALTYGYVAARDFVGQVAHVDFSVESRFLLL